MNLCGRRNRPVANEKHLNARALRVHEEQWTGGLVLRAAVYLVLSKYVASGARAREGAMAIHAQLVAYRRPLRALVNVYNDISTLMP